jgi:hypothetical protein
VDLIREKDKICNHGCRTKQVIVATNAFGIDSRCEDGNTPATRKFGELLSGSRTPEETVKSFAVLLTTSDIIQVENQFIKVLPDKNS